MNEILESNSRSEWDEYVLENSGHPLQLSGWGELKAAHGWRVHRVFAKKDGKIIGCAQILTRSLPGPLKVLAYVPRGPVVAELKNRPAVLSQLVSYAKNNLGAVTIKIEPDWQKTIGLENWRQSKNTILIPKTLILDLDKPEDDLLAAMSKKTRQYIRKSSKSGLVIKRVESRADLAQCLDIYRQTAGRAGFAIHGDDYYYDLFDKLAENSPVLAAYSDDKPVAFLWLAASRSVAFELYGGVNDTGQELRANYALKWQAIRLIKQQGIRHYDMNGLLNDGVSNFKRGFADHENMLVGTYDKPLSIWYPVWEIGLPTAKKIIRRLKNR